MNLDPALNMLFAEPQQPLLSAEDREQLIQFAQQTDDEDAFYQKLGEFLERSLNKRIEVANATNIAFEKEAAVLEAEMSAKRKALLQDFVKALAGISNLQERGKSIASYYEALGNLDKEQKDRVIRLATKLFLGF